MVEELNIYDIGKDRDIGSDPPLLTPIYVQGAFINKCPWFYKCLRFLKSGFSDFRFLSRPKTNSSCSKQLKEYGGYVKINGVYLLTTYSFYDLF